MNKQRGSAIVTVLLVAMLIVISGTVVTMGILYNTQGNANSKEMTDVAYAAESGVDKAISSIVKSESNGITAPSILTVNEFKNDFGINVSVKLNKIIGANKYEVESTAKKGLKKKVVKATIEKGQAEGNVFSNLICGSKIEIIGGSVNIGTGDINTSQNNAVIGGGSTVNPINHTNFSYTLPVYNFEKMEKDPVTGKSILTASSTADVIAKLDSLVISKKGVRKIEFRSTKIPKNYKVYLINADNFTLHMPGSGGNFSHLIFIGSNDFTIENTNVVNFNQSTVIGDKIIFDGVGSVTMSYAPHTMPDHPWHAYSTLSDSDLDFMNRTIADNYAPNWPTGNSSGGTSTSNGWEITSYEY